MDTVTTPQGWFAAVLQAKIRHAGTDGLRHHHSSLKTGSRQQHSHLLTAEPGSAIFPARNALHDRASDRLEADIAFGMAIGVRYRA